MSLLILKNRNFGLLWFGQLISQLGDKIFLLAVMWYVLDITGKASSVSLVMFFQVIPVIFFGPLAGVLVDRSNKKAIIVLSDFIRGILVTIVAFGVYKGNMSVYGIYAVIFLISTISSLFNPSIAASVPLIVREDELENAMAYQSSLRDMASIFGAAVGGILIGFFGVFYSFLINGISYILSAIFELPIKIKKVIRKENSHFLKDLKEGFEFVYHNKTLKHMLTLFAFLNFFGPPTVIIIPVIVKKLNFNPSFLGYFEMSMAIGSFLGALSVTKITPNNHKILFLTIMLMISGLILFSMGYFIDSYVLLGILMFLGLVLAWINVNLIIFFQRLTPDYIKGRVFSILETFSMIIVPLSFLVFGFTVDRFGYSMNVFVMGSAIAISSIYFYFVPGLREKLN